MGSEFLPAFNATLVNEGFPGYAVDNNGAEVCAGINRAYWPGWCGWPIIDALRTKGLGRKGINAALKADARLLPLMQDFYRRNFWVAWMQQITAQQVANWAFDKSVNMGIGQAVKLIQRAAGVADDGRFGPATLAAVNTVDPVVLVGLCHNEAVKFYEALHAKDPAKYSADMVNRA